MTETIATTLTTAATCKACTWECRPPAGGGESCQTCPREGTAGQKVFLARCWHRAALARKRAGDRPLTSSEEAWGMSTEEAFRKKFLREAREAM